MFDVIWHGLKDSFLMLWEVWWALVLGFVISAVPSMVILLKYGRQGGKIDVHNGMITSSAVSWPMTLA